MNSNFRHMFSALDLRSVAGLATIWFTLMVSPYYPLSLSSATMANSAALLSTYHLLYSLFLILAYGCLIGIRRPLAGHRPVWLRRIAGVAGFVGCLFFLLRPDQGPNLLAFDVIALALTAFSTAFFFIAWLAACSQHGRAHSVLTIGFSFVVFSALWIVLIFLGKGPLSFVSTLCPLLSLALLEGTGALPRETPVSESVRSLRPLPWGLIALLVVFIFFGALSVRLFTTMGSGIDMIGLLQPVAQVTTAATGLVLIGAATAFFSRREASTSNIISMVALVALIYMGTLLVLNLAHPDGLWATFAKRVLVGAEHSTEVLLLICLASKTARRHLSCPLVYGSVGIVAFTLPQLVSQDVMLSSGALASVAASPLVAPLASAGAFFIAAAAIGLLVAYSRGTVERSQLQGDEWQANVCRRATASYDISSRELDVVSLTYRGYSAKRIAETLLVSESTVKSHLSHVYRKLSVKNKQELIALLDTYRSN